MRNSAIPPDVLEKEALGLFLLAAGEFTAGAEQHDRMPLLIVRLDQLRCGTALQSSRKTAASKKVTVELRATRKLRVPEKRRSA